MSARVESTFRDLLSVLQIIKLYTAEHPMFQGALHKAYLSLQDILKDKEELVIGIIGEELAFEKEIFFDLSKMTKPAILYLKERGVERIVFLRGLEEAELGKFIKFLAAPKGEITSSPQEYLSLIGVRNIVAGKVSVDAPGAGKGQGPGANTFINIYDNALDKISQAIGAVLSGESLDQLSLRFSIHNVMESLSTDYKEFLKLTSVKRYSQETFIHLLNVSVLSMYFSSKLGFSREDVLDIGVAALFHDIGKLYISRGVLHKDSKLTVDEFARIKSHTVLGAEFMLKYTDKLGIMPVVVSFEHHLKYDLSGYPKEEFPVRPHTASLIVSICDVYDALSQRRSYKSDYPPEMIHDIMVKERGVNFESGLLDKFYSIMGVWPIGSLVELSNGYIAAVRQENPDDIFAPRVEVIRPLENKGEIDLKERKGTLKIARFINPLQEGKDLLSSV